MTPHPLDHGLNHGCLDDSSWRFSFDRANGDLYIADVGQNAREEIDYQPAASGGGENYGWNCFEGTLAFDPVATCSIPPQTLCPPASHTPPLHEYSHASGCSVTGGYVYRGCRQPDLQGTYFYSDWCSAFVRTFEVVAGSG